MSLSLLQSSLANERHHLSPFLMLGDPSPDASVALCRALVDGGATMLELGMPYADPSADGPAVQAAGLRARAAGVSTGAALEILRCVRAACPQTPLNLLVYGNLVHARGYVRFSRDAVAAGASSLLVPDIPLEEGEPLRAACRDQKLGVVMLAGPRTPDDRLRRIAAVADGFVYLAGHQGITGATASGDEQRRQLVTRVAATIDAPLCVGFGLQSHSHVQAVHDAGGRIAVVGSHLLRVIERAIDHSQDTDALLAAVLPAFQQLMPSPDRPRENPSCS